MDIDSLRFAQRLDGINGSAIREIFKLLARPNMISFAGGNPAASALPNDELAPIAQEVLLKDGKTILQYGATEGYKPFVETLIPYIGESFGFPVDASEVLPTTGSTQAMNLLCAALIDKGDSIIVEDPTFLGNMQCMRLYQANLVPVSSDEDGMNTDELEEKIKKHHPKLIYIIPTFQNPTGRTLSLERRKKVAELAEKYGVLVAEDDPYRDLRYAGEALPTIKSFDQSGWVAFMGSFSKIISPGMRVGFLAAEKKLLRKCVIVKQSSDLHTALLTQAMCREYIERGLLKPHIKAICTSYREQMNAMLDALSHMSAFTSYTRPEGGLFLFAALKEGMDALKILPKVVEKGVAYVPGTHFYTEGGHENTLRLNFSNASPDAIRRGMALLEEALTE